MSLPRVTSEKKIQPPLILHDGSEYKQYKLCHVSFQLEHILETFDADEHLSKKP